MGLWFEELTPGLVIEHQIRRTVTESDNVLFSTLTMNPQPLHLDEEFAKDSEFGTRVVNGLFTLSLVIGLSVTDISLGTTVANLGYEVVEMLPRSSTATRSAWCRPSWTPGSRSHAPRRASSSWSTGALTSATSWSAGWCAAPCSTGGLAA
ncbi:MaoC family dehydratase [Nonomuraea ferruginea]